MASGIQTRHSRTCRSIGGGRCSCSPSYRAEVYSPRDGKKIRKTFSRLAEAKSWRADAKRSIDQGVLRAPERTTLSQAAEEWLAGVESGEILSRAGGTYKPATIRGYRQALSDRVLPVLGNQRLSSISTLDNGKRVR